MLSDLKVSFSLWRINSTSISNGEQELQRTEVKYVKNKKNEVAIKISITPRAYVALRTLHIELYASTHSLNFSAAITCIKRLYISYRTKAEILNPNNRGRKNTSQPLEHLQWTNCFNEANYNYIFQAILIMPLCISDFLKLECAWICICSNCFFFFFNFWKAKDQ